MWTRKDWFCLSFSATAAFGGTLVAFYPALVTAGGQAPPPVVIKVPTLTIDGVTLNASAMKDDKVLGLANSTTLVAPGLLPNIELKASNTTDSEKTVQISSSLLTSSIPSMLSRVPMPTTSPKSQWGESMTLDLKPGESRVIDLSTGVKLATMSSATLQLAADGKKVDLMTLSTRPQPRRAALSAAPATRPSGDTAVSDAKEVR